MPLRAESPIRRFVAEIAPASRAEQTGGGAPGAFRVDARLRDSELFLLVLSLCAGAAAGIGVILIDLLLAWLRQVAFGVSPGQHLSDVELAPARVLLIPGIGGLLVGLVSEQLRRWRPREVVDAIEANALFGGRMSVGNSLGLVAVTLSQAGSEPLSG